MRELQADARDPNSVSTTIPPPSSPAATSASDCSAGAAAFGSTCTSARRGPRIPCSRACSMNGARITSTTAARSIRAAGPAPARASVATGSRSTSGCCHAASPSGRSATAGSTGTSAVRSTRSAVATRKSGVAIMTTVRVVTSRSAALPSRMPDARPRPVAATAITATARAVIVSVSARRSARTGAISRPETSERPRSPCSAPAAQVRYLSATGWSRPRSVRRAARSADVAPVPASAPEASPGSAAALRNTTTERASRVSSAAAHRPAIQTASGGPALTLRRPG
ncbi:hypothetical protein BC477_03370 [Clavibacter michiganensis subsp. michiganensis]|uniref:Uncharacterized protein n=1 Tax=Clavibacter michiganensis subsp. michiganensis TaxID=33013 RepID=A0A251XKM7_CLAMM|nr:hypothetical protein BC477_03370 [Clavibacter michiganensis subsp. michiganensis]OUE03753.1 hypothetical protein CMMCAS07_02305 [Clavibacter michiganensis subsp. michiganensis]